MFNVFMIKNHLNINIFIDINETTRNQQTMCPQKASGTHDGSVCAHSILKALPPDSQCQLNALSWKSSLNMVHVCS